MSIAVVVIVTTAWVVIVGGVIASNRSPAIAESLARVFWWAALAISGVAFASGIASVAGLVPTTETMRLIHRVLIYRGCLVVGVAVASVALLTLRRPAVQAFVTSRHVPRGLCVSVALAFLVTEVAKLAHDTEMRQFFVESGYPVWFLYATISAEVLGSVGLVVSRRTTAVAAAGLAVIMIGAIYTHHRNGDPFTASLEAAHLLVILICILVLGRQSRRYLPG